MNLENQVTNLELSKKLKYLNIKQESLFYWTVGGVASRLDALPILESNYSAYTASELMELLPDRIILPKAEPFDCYRFHLKRFLIAESQCEKYNLPISA